MVKLSLSNDFCLLEGRFHGNVRFLAILGFSRERGEKGKGRWFFHFSFLKLGVGGGSSRICVSGSRGRVVESCWGEACQAMVGGDF